LRKGEGGRESFYASEGRGKNSTRLKEEEGACNIICLVVGGEGGGKGGGKGRIFLSEWGWKKKEAISSSRNRMATPLIFGWGKNKEGGEGRKVLSYLGGWGGKMRVP